MNIIARKPAKSPRYAEGAEFAVVHRQDHYHPYVSVMVTPHSLSFGEWFYGYSFETEAEALAHFNKRN